jgi:hypothetical protein
VPVWKSRTVRAGGTSDACHDGSGLQREERLNWGHTSLGSSLGILATVCFARYLEREDQR